VTPDLETVPWVDAGSEGPGGSLDGSAAAQDRAPFDADDDEFHVAAQRRGAITERVAPRLSLPRATGVVVTLAGVLLLAFCGYLFGWTNLQAERSQRALLSQYTANTNNPTRAQVAAFHGRTPPDGALAAVLRVPAIGLREAVVQGTSSSDLQEGPGLMPRTAVPGTRGEAVIVGRRSTFGAPFARLASLQPGERLSVTDFVGDSTYVVRSVQTLASGSVERVSRTSAAKLTLVTLADSFPPSGLVVVHADMLGTPKPTAVSTRPQQATEYVLGGDGGAWWQLLCWFLLLVVGLTGGALVYRRLRQPLVAYMLAAPVVIVAVLFTFANLAKLLPAAL
jgi:sortase A